MASTSDKLRMIILLTRGPSSLEICTEILGGEEVKEEEERIEMQCPVPVG
jgi:hypothetical protein